MTQPLMSFTSHVQGKNARVELFPDRIEWSKKGSTAARATAATLTVGLSLLGGRKEERETVLLKAVTNVSAKRDGLMNSVVTVTTAGGAVGFRCSHGEAEQLKSEMLRLMAAA